MIKSKNKHGFSLIEVLTAMAIFVIIILMMSSVFHQASVAWDSGTRKAQGGMEVRTMIGFMAKELMQAVAFKENGKGALSIFNMQAGEAASSIEFITLEGEPGSITRQAKRIFYGTVGGGSIVERKVERWPANANYRDESTAWQMDAEVIIIATNIAEVLFIPAPKYLDVNGIEWDYAPNKGVLPKYITIRAAVDRMNDVSGVGARSYGPDKQPGTADDIVSE